MSCANWRYNVNRALYCIMWSLGIAEVTCSMAEDASYPHYPHIPKSNKIEIIEHEK